MKLTSLDLHHPGIMLTDNVVSCARCGYAHLYELPDASTVARYYEDDQFYNLHSPPGWFEKERDEYEAGLWDAYFAYLASFLDPTRPVIDIGAGCGWFVAYLFKRGYHVVGVEPSESARAFSPILNCMFESVEQVVEWNPDFRCGAQIVCMLTLEHIVDPLRWLKVDIMTRLNGRLIVTVPNDFSDLQRCAGGDWFVSPVHVNYFSGNTLRMLLERAGLEVVTESATAPLELAVLAGYDYRGDDSKGRKVHNWRLRFERRFGRKAFMLYKALYHAFGWGRELVFIAEKKKDRSDQ